MIRLLLENNGRLVVHCDNCPIQLDLGPAVIVRTRNRTPSGWLNAGRDTHFCPMCAAKVSVAALTATFSEPTTQPLA